MRELKCYFFIYNTSKNFQNSEVMLTPILCFMTKICVLSEDFPFIGFQKQMRERTQT